jgi:squalene-hopene/tetraprenyl-beta-curcumene cyclase
LSINALGAGIPDSAVAPLQDWLLGQQYRDVHPYTNADPGGWAWTDLSGGVPDADDTPGAILALCGLAAGGRARERTLDAASRGIDWLLDVQNSDGGWPSFCRGWGTLPFDRSAPDLTAHAIRALACWLHMTFGVAVCPGLKPAKSLADRRRWRPYRALVRGFEYLKRTQRPDGSWLPLWFGNQHAPHEENPTYGTSRVLTAYRDAGWTGDSAFENGVEWLKAAQNPDGGWGGAAGIVSSIEETALALELLISLEAEAAVPGQTTANGLSWLLNQIDNGKLMEPSPIGFYFAKLWYFEKLYPVIFSVAALRRAVELLGAGSGAEAAGDF